MKKIVLIFFLFVSLISFSDTETAEVQKPWNGYWWPIKEGALFNGENYRQEPSTLFKYDKAFDLFGNSYKWEQKNHFEPDGPSWFGHCNGWACASILSTEPSGTFAMNNIIFYTGDIKGLLTMYYQSGTGTLYGDRYMGEGDDLSDMDPLLFQTKIQEYIRDNHIAILMDNDPGVEIWTYPIYKYALTWNDEGNIRHVTATVFYPTDFVQPDFVGSTIHSDIYTYDLTLSNGQPISGEWTGDSIDKHPDFLWYPDIVEYHGTNNPYISLENIQTILDSDYNINKDDSFEDNNNIDDSVELDTNEIGRSLDKDYFNFSVEPGENFTVNYKDNSDSNHYNWLKLFDQGGNKLETYSKKGDNFIDIGYVYLNFSATSFENYFFAVEQQVNPSEKFEDNYRFTVEYSSKYTVLPHVINDPYWTTLYLAGYFPITEDLDTEQSQSSDFNQINIFEKNIVGMSTNSITPNTFLNVSFDNSESFPEWTKLNSPTDNFRVYSFFLSGGEGSMAFLQNSNPISDFILPHIPNETEFWWYGLLLLNPNRFSSANLQYTILFNDNTEAYTGTIKLQGYEKKVGVFSDFFPEVNMNNVSYIKFSSDSPVIASSLYGTLNHKELSYVPVSSNGFTQNQSFYIPCTLLNSSNSWQGAVFINKGTNNTILRFNITKKDNSHITVDLPLLPNEKWVGEIKELLPTGTTYEECQLLTATVLSNDAEIVGFTMFGNHEEGILTSFPLLETRVDYSYDIIFPYIETNLIKTKLLFLSQKNYNLSEGIMVNALNNEGEVLETVHLGIDAYSNLELDLSAIFSAETISSLNSIQLKSSHFIIPTLKLYSENNKYFEIISPIFD